MANRRLRLLAIAALIAPALAACGGTPAHRTAATTGPTPTPSVPAIATPSPVAAANGAKVTGTGYVFRAPKRWRDLGKSLSSRGVDAAAAAATPTAGFTSNINVVIVNEGFTSAQVEQVTQRARAEVDGKGTGYKIEPPTTVAGSIAGHLRGPHMSGTTQFWLEQYLISHGMHTYVVSFSFSPRTPATQRDQLIASVLASWTWA